MSKYIDVEKIKYTEYINGDVTVSKEYIDEMQAADVQPVVHAHWNFEKFEVNGKNILYACCSSCGDGVEDDTMYCPNCGALMEEKKDE